MTSTLNNGSHKSADGTVQQRVHEPVLLEEAMANLALKANGIYVDATFGRGGHTSAMLKQVKHVYAFDRDPTAHAHAEKHFSEVSNFTLINRPFSELQQGLQEHGVDKIDGLLMDLGVSSPQLDVAERGFSFRLDGPLDMRMDYTRGQPVSDWLAEAGHQDIARVLRTYGDESEALSIASKIIQYRAHTPLTRTSQLADIVSQVKSHKSRRAGKGVKKSIHPATKTFQALRIFINQEMQELEACLQQGAELLNPNGRLCVISFHSLEDRIVKRFMRDASRSDPALSRLPEIPRELQPKFKIIGKAIKAGKAEIEKNPRARSAVLRVVERVAQAA
ncbi:MAG: 16S rRNA (cytosine(1402)-N(4))-methyltransferase RsmH [Gammaproteobacteria bacterium]|nr:16S rRNA (cytosine(1402)-N(4))-methyltransferase RsmH [Gammaproteobacteria bacterium]